MTKSTPRSNLDTLVVELLEMIVEKIEPRGRYSEPKHGIVGTPLTDKFWEMKRAAEEI